MANLKIRYGGQITALDSDGFNFSPANYGTARLNVKVNSSSTAKFGLTTNTNAKEYCKAAIRIGGQIAYIGRVSSIEYASGDTIDRKGSSVVSSDFETFTTNYETGSSTSDANPTIRTITNATGSSVTSAVDSELVQTATWYSFMYSNQVVSRTRNDRLMTAFTSTKQDAYSVTGTGVQSTQYDYIDYYYITYSKYSGTNYNNMSTLLTYLKGSNSLAKSIYSFRGDKLNLGGGSGYAVSKTASNYARTYTTPWSLVSQNEGNLASYYTSRRAFNDLYKTSATIIMNTGNYKGKNYLANATGYVYTYSSRTYTSPQALATYYSYSTRYSYSWESCSINTSISETLHNMNI